MDSIDVYEVLVKQHESMLFAYVMGWVRDPAMAESVVQEAFVIGFQKLAMLEKKERFAAWIRAIARNLAFAELKRRNREMPVDQAVLEGMEEVFSPFDQAAEAETWEERIRALRQCFELLPEKLRQVCHRHYFEDHSVREITEGLKIGMDAVKKRLERARDAIRECIEKRLKLEEPQYGRNEIIR
jgi:RNA polymerase sigma-70 factor (ECF subfamily)